MNCRRFIAFLGSRTTLKHQLSHRADQDGPALLPYCSSIKRQAPRGPRLDAGEGTDLRRYHGPAVSTVRAVAAGMRLTFRG